QALILSSNISTNSPVPLTSLIPASALNTSSNNSKRRLNTLTARPFSKRKMRTSLGRVSLAFPALQLLQILHQHPPWQRHLLLLVSLDLDQGRARELLQLLLPLALGRRRMKSYRLSVQS